LLNILTKRKLRMQAALNLPHSETLSQNEIRVQRQLLEALLFEGQLEVTELNRREVTDCVSR
jgi:hypothetical protein